ncbi:MAG TPA: AMP-binding protein, partial [Thermoanaerobaculia bacterium]|nr:AMP-binding protein [Thermoanaerobaculia bacterium]
MARCRVRLEGEVREPLLRQAVESVVERHEILRTWFPYPDGMKEPVQSVAARGRVEWSDEEPADGPVLWARLAERWLELSLPALCADVRTLANLYAEIGSAYAAGAGAGADEEVVQYVQFSEWQNETVEEGDAEGEAFWRAVGEASELVLPLERRSETEPRQPLRRLVRRLPAGLVAAGEALLRERGGSWPALGLACWQILLGRITDRPQVTVEVVLDGRAYEELQGGLGLYARAVPVVGRVGEGQSLVSALEQAASSLAAAARWQEWAPEPGGDGVGFEWNDLPAAHMSAGLRLELAEAYACAAPCKLKLSCAREADGSVVCELHYRPERFESAAVEHLWGWYESLLESALRHPALEVGELELLGGTERQRLLADFNRTAWELPQAGCLHELFAAQALRTPEAPALVWEGGCWTYGELLARSQRLSRRLRGLGVGADRVVGVFLERSPEMVVAALAALEAGGAYLPLDPGEPRLAWMLEDARPVVVVTRSELAARLPEGTAVALVESGEEAPCPAWQPASPETLAYVLYTSGSTGRQKGVLVPHRGVVSYLSWCREAYGLTAGGGAPVHTPLGFDLTVTSLWGPLVAGGAATLLREEAGVGALASALEAGGGFGLVKLTPAHLELLPPGAVPALVVGGEALLGETLAPWAEHAPSTLVFNEYGPTETVVGCCVHAAPAGTIGGGPVPIGRPVGNARLYVLDRRRRPVGAGVAGE